MDEATSFDTQKRQTINPMVDEINKQTEPLLKVAMKELGYEIPLYVRVYNQVRFYEESGKLKSGFSVASKETLAKQFDVNVKQIESAFNNLTNKYKLGSWIEHSDPVYRNVRRTWVSNIRLNRGLSDYYSGIEEGHNYYSGIAELLQWNSTAITAEQLTTEGEQGSQSKDKVSESKSITNVISKTPKKYNNTNKELLNLLNRITKRNFRVLPLGYKKTLEQFTLKEIEQALNIMVNDEWHKMKIYSLKSDYILRASTIDNMLSRGKPKEKIDREENINQFSKVIEYASEDN